MSLVNATDTGASPDAQSARPTTPPPAPDQHPLPFSSLPDAPMKSGAGDSLQGFKIVRGGLDVQLKQDLKDHHVEDVPIPRPIGEELEAASSFVQETPLYANGRWTAIPVKPENEKKLYAPQAEIFSAIESHFAIPDRRFLETHGVFIEHVKSGEEELASSPDYIVVGIGPSVSDRSDFSALKDRRNKWINYDYVTTLGDAKTDKNASSFRDIGQLAVYARQCFIQQYNRDSVFGFIMTETTLRVHQFDRSGAMSSLRLNYHEEPAYFVHALRTIISSDPAAIGYNTTISFGSFGADGRAHTRHLESMFGRPRKAGDRDDLPEIPVDADRQDGLDLIGVEMPPYVRELIKFNVDMKPFYARRSLRGRGGIYWNGSHEDYGAVIIKQSYLPATRTPEWEFLKRTAGLTGVGEILAYDLRKCCAVLRRYGETIDEFKSPLQLLVAVRDAIQGHWNLWKIYILHRDVSIQNILLGRPGAEDGWRGVLIDLDMAICLYRQTSDANVDFRTGTRAYQSVQVLRSYKYAESAPTSGQRLMHDYMDDLESFYWCLCWICFSYEGPGNCKKSDIPKEWQDNDPQVAAGAKSEHLLSDFESNDVKDYFEDFIPLLEFLHGLFQKMYKVKTPLVRKHAAHTRTLKKIREEAKGTYEQVIEMFDRTIDSIRAGGRKPAAEKHDQPPATLTLAALPPAPRVTTRMLEPSLPMSFGNKRKASEDSDEEPEKKRPQVASTAPTKPSSLRHSESYDP
ncbi:hypothetical protein GGF50DRAFT_55590 [Schizophyllum commune]